MSELTDALKDLALTPFERLHPNHPGHKRVASLSLDEQRERIRDYIAKNPEQKGLFLEALDAHLDRLWREFSDGDASYMGHLIDGHVMDYLVEVIDKECA